MKDTSWELFELCFCRYSLYHPEYKIAITNASGIEGTIYTVYIYRKIFFWWLRVACFYCSAKDALAIFKHCEKKFYLNPLMNPQRREVMNKTTDNFAESMFATKESLLKNYSDEDLKAELQKRGYSLILKMVERKDMIDADLGSGL